MLSSEVMKCNNLEIKLLLRQCGTSDMALSINIFRNINSIESALPAPEPADSEGQYSELDI